MRIITFLLIFLLFTLHSSAQSTFTLSGKITDAQTGEDLIAASVLIPERNVGAVSNSYGFYSISLPEGRYNVRYSYVGYKSVEKVVDLSRNVLMNVEIEPLAMELDEVVVKAERNDRNITSADPGVEKLNLKDIQTIPVLFGERDILKTIQLLPGISNAAEGSTGFNVRGGSMGQNLILLDEAPVYSSAHLAGFFSVFNSDAIKDVTVYKGAVPSNYGGRASSVLDITMNNGNSKKFCASGGLGLVSSRLTLEGPIVKDKMSFIVSGRRTYGDLVAKLLFPGDVIRDDMNFYFYDLNAKLNWTMNDRNRLFLSGYFGKDVFELGDNIGTGWGNTTGTLRWNHLFSERLFSNASLIYSKYDYGFIFGASSMRLRSGIEDFSIKEEAMLYVNPRYTLKFGLHATWHEFNPGEVSMDRDSAFQVIQFGRQGAEGAAYLHADQKVSDRLTASYGLRLSAFSQVGPGWFYDYDEENIPVDSVWYGEGEMVYPEMGIEPRVALNYMFGEKSSVKVSYNRMAQYLHLLSNTTAGSPTDVWMPGSNNLKPVMVDHYSAGYFRNFMDNTIETSAEVYYKNMQNTADYEDGAEIIFNEHAESEIMLGKGRSYGLELYVKKKYGTLSGWVSYTLSRTENKIEGINDFEWYPMRYDRTHDVEIIGIIKTGKRSTLTGVWTYATGNAVTFPSGRYEIANNLVPYYTERNGYRMPAYHRMDLSFRLEGKKKRRWRSAWDFSVYNAYNRRNAYMISFRESETVVGKTEAVKLSLFGIVPSVGVEFGF